MDKESINKNILDNSFYMISLFENAREMIIDDESDNGSSSESIVIPKEESEDERDARITKYMKDNCKSITNLKLQKLMYFVEIYYLAKNDKKKDMFNSEWSAWDYGPVNKKLYDYFKKFGSLEISLTDYEKQKINSLCDTYKKYIDDIYYNFGSLSAFDLVTLTHLEGSPWYNIKKANNDLDFQKLNDTVIDKKDSVKWFKKTFSFLFIDESSEKKHDKK